MLDSIAEALDERLLERAVQKALQRLRQLRAPDTTKERQARGRVAAPGGPHADDRGGDLHGLTPQRPCGRSWELPSSARTSLVAELEALTSRRQAAASLDVERLRRELLRHAAEIRILLGQDIPRRSCGGCW